MTIETIEKEFRSSVCESVRLRPEGVERYRVFTPFRLEDGDHLCVVLKQEEGRWVLTDEGHTLMHLTYDIDERDLRKGARVEMVETALSSFGVTNRGGEFVLPVPDDKYGDALYSYVQALLRITNVTLLSRERVRSTFLDDFRTFMEEKVPAARRTFDWHDGDHDPDGMYPVDCRINGLPRPLFVFAIPSDGKARDATISILQFERWGLEHRAVGIFENQEQISRKVLARFSDMCGKQFSSLVANRDRVERYVGDALENWGRYCVVDDLGGGVTIQETARSARNPR